MMKSLHLQHRREASLLCISLQGRLDGNSAREFESFVDTHLTQEDRGLVLEAAELQFLSSAGLRELMLLARRLGKKGAKASIVGASPVIRETLEITGIDSLFHFANDLESARTAAQAGRGKVTGFLESWFNFGN